MRAEAAPTALRLYRPGHANCRTSAGTSLRPVAICSLVAKEQDDLGMSLALGIWWAFPALRQAAHHAVALH